MVVRFYTRSTRGSLSSRNIEDNFPIPLQYAVVERGQENLNKHFHSETKRMDFSKTNISIVFPKLPLGRLFLGIPHPRVKEHFWMGPNPDRVYFSLGSVDSTLGVHSWGYFSSSVLLGCK